MYYRYEPADTLTADQTRKRERAMEATLLIVGEQGLKGVTMKAVAATSGVALGTLYRFFVTKDHLLAASFLHWALPIHAEVLEHPGAAGRAEMEQMFRRGSYVYRDQPHMLALLVHVFSSTDEHAAAETQKLRDFLNRAMGALLQGPEERAHAVSEILQAVWLDALFAHRRGIRSLEQGLEQLDTALMLLTQSG